MLRSLRGAGAACLARGGITHSSAVFLFQGCCAGAPRAGGDIGPDGGSGNFGAGMEARERRGRRGVSGHTLGGVSVTGGVWAARCAYDFVKPRSRRGRGDGVFAFGAASRNRPRYFAPGLVCLIFFLTAFKQGEAAGTWVRENVGRGGVTFRWLERSELGSAENARFAAENGCGGD